MRTTRPNPGAFLIVLTLVGCAGVEIGPPNPGEDAGVTEAVRQAPLVHPCHEDAVQDDFWNCGACGNACDASDADSCADGLCQCGNGPGCEPGSDCRGGACVPVDEEGDVCEFDGQCSASHGCIEGHCTFIRCVAEVCDGVDNDCDGEIDEAETGGPLSEWCFSGVDDGHIMAPCQRGVRSCVDGDWTACMGEVAPTPESGLLRCDGVDNDCDRCIDGTFVDGACVSRAPTSYDVVYLIDISGSMQGTIDAVRDATRTFSSRFSEQPGFRFGIVQIPAPEGDGDRPGLYTDLTDFDSFDTALSTVDADGDYGLEPQRDAVFEIGTGEIPLTWAEDSVRILILFTDEEAQSYRTLHGLSAVGEVEMCGALRHGEVLAVVTDDIHFPDYDECALTIEMSTAEEMEQGLDEIIADPCAADQERWKR